jgi:hypothetical protein
MDTRFLIMNAEASSIRSSAADRVFLTRASLMYRLVYDSLALGNTAQLDA